MPEADFPRLVSLTITDTCNLRCRMCGQWSDHGSRRGQKDRFMEAAIWKRLVDEVADHPGTGLLVRGGEPFLYPDIIDVLGHVKRCGLSVSIDTNGTRIAEHAQAITDLGVDHLTISIDGPAEIHDHVRRRAGCYERIRKGLVELQRLQRGHERRTSLSLCFTISGDSYRGLGQMPGIARARGVPTLSVAPYFYVTEAVGREHERIMRDELGCEGRSWRGFHHESSGVDVDEFLVQLRQFERELGEIEAYPYMPLTDEEYRAWFESCVEPVGPLRCGNVHGLLDVQPDGGVNFCVDFPDYFVGNVRESSLAELWKSDRAQRFRDYRDERPLPVCVRCGARYMVRE
jgi:MoaA/NifB/PqqE/SkfB family radical SAM enzyme